MNLLRCNNRLSFFLIWIPHITRAFHTTYPSTLFHKLIPPCYAHRRFAVAKNNTENQISVQSSEIDTDLSAEERTVVNVFRKCGPSVGYVTSLSFLNETFTPFMARPNSRRTDNLPRTGMSLGSGSAFLITDDGYLVTNYHVIERAYRIQQMNRNFHSAIDSFLQNITFFPLEQNQLGSSIVQNNIVESSWWRDTRNVTKSILRSLLPFSRLDSKVYTRINSSTQYKECRIVDVAPEWDMAILKINDAPLTPSDKQTVSSYTPIAYGSSSDLLVGQRIIAIGNPFGLDRTVTAGVVSALDRSVVGVAGNEIKGCIQTDAAINPGNSGGPALDSKGRVVGINTMIYTTSGSNAGIGFAIPIDSVRERADLIVEKDRFHLSQSTGSKVRVGRGWLGLELVADESLNTALWKKLQSKSNDITNLKPSQQGVFVMSVRKNSPADVAGIQGLRMPANETGVVNIGDRIIALGGRMVESRTDLEKDIRTRAEGEQISVTIEDHTGNRRVLYVTLARKPF